MVVLHPLISEQYPLMERNAAWAQTVGRGMVRALPILIRLISHGGTVALLLVAGGIFHHIEAVHHVFHGWPSLLVASLFGPTVGGFSVLFVAGCRRLLGSRD